MGKEGLGSYEATVMPQGRVTAGCGIALRGNSRGYDGCDGAEEDANSDEWGPGRLSMVVRTATVRALAIFGFGAVNEGLLFAAGAVVRGAHFVEETVNTPGT